jgi:hypothetical protein
MELTILTANSRFLQSDVTGNQKPGNRYQLLRNLSLDDRVQRREAKGDVDQITECGGSAIRNRINDDQKEKKIRLWVLEGGSDLVPFDIALLGVGTSLAVDNASIRHASLLRGQPTHLSRRSKEEVHDHGQSNGQAAEENRDSFPGSKSTRVVLGSRPNAVVDQARQNIHSGIGAPPNNGSHGVFVFSVPRSSDNEQGWICRAFWGLVSCQKLRELQSKTDRSSSNLPATPSRNLRTIRPAKSFANAMHKTKIPLQ